MLEPRPDVRLQLAQAHVDATFGTEYRRQQGVNGKSNSLGFTASIPLQLFNRNQGEIARANAKNPGHAEGRGVAGNHCFGGPDGARPA